MKKITPIFFIALVALTPSSSLFALESDKNQPAQIQADDTEIDFRTGVRTLTGNVLVVQGTLRLKADKLVATYKNGELIKAVADGSLARFKQRPDGEQQDVEGWAKNILVDYIQNTITLTSKAALKQGQSTSNGDRILYNMATNNLKILGGSTANIAGKNGAAPKKQLVDPFKDDAPSPNSETGKAKVAKSTQSSATESVNDAEPKTTEPAPVKSGRSRLILQPKKKD